MAATKRRRLNKKRSTSAAAALSTSNPTSESSFVIEVLDVLMEISKSKTRSIAVLQGFCDGKCLLQPPGSPKKTFLPHLDCYWIVLGTHLMNRLLPDTDNDSTISLLAAFCDTMSSILLSDKAKLERASHVAASRSIVARATLTIAVSSLYCLEQYELISENTMQACISALDRLVHLQGVASSGNSWNLPEKCSVSLSEEEKALILCLRRVPGEDETETNTMPASPSSGKRKSRRKTSGTAEFHTMDTVALFKALEDVQNLASFLDQRIDGRVALKRWASMALVWYCHGQVHLLELTHKVALDRTYSSSKRSELMNILVQLVCESGNQCGMRSPAAGMDQYLKNILSWNTKRFPNAGRKAKVHRTDIRDWATVAIHDLISVHKECLQSITSASLVGSTLVNDKDLGEDSDDFNGGLSSTNQSASTASKVFTAPELSTTLKKLCRAAASSVLNSTFPQQALWTRSLMSLAMSNALELAADTALPIDCKLTTFALEYLADTLSHLESQPISSLSKEKADPGYSLEETYSLKEPLPSPDVSIINPNYYSPNWTCSYAGMASSLHFEHFSEEHTLAMAIRALSATSSVTSIAQFVSVLTGIVYRAYDTRTSVLLEERDTIPLQKGKKRGTKGGNPKRKRLKTDQGPVEPNIRWHRLSKARSIVAIEALKALRLCLMNKPHQKTLLLHSIRKALTTRHYFQLIELGELLDQILVKTRVSKPLRIPASDDDSELSEDPFSANGISDFYDFEKRLWSTHMGMCQILGRGCSDPDNVVVESPLMAQPILGTSSQRKIVFQTLAKSRTIQHGISGWPLSLPAAHHVFLQANMSSEPMGVGRSLCMAEQYTTKELTKSITYMLLNIENLKTKEWEPDKLYIDDEIPLSYQDARTFLLAFCRLKKEDQRDCLEELISQTLDSIMSIRKDKAKLSALTKSREASAFLARVLVSCYCLLDIFTMGKCLENLVFVAVGRAQAKLPQFVSRSEWYRDARCFMGMFSWESPALPDCSSSPSTDELKAKTIQDLQQLFKMSFQLGFESACNDKCQLLFASWNGLDKINCMKNREVPFTNFFPSLYPSVKNDLSTKVLQLRDDVCALHLEFKQEDDSRTPPLVKASHLRNMLGSANVLLDSLLSSHVLEDDAMSQDIPSSVFALLAALPVYISASVAGHTKSGNGHFSSILSKGAVRRKTRNRGYSSESEQLELLPLSSDEDSVETDGRGYDSDSRADAFARLRDCCHAFGAAPTHPDWLDDSCTLRVGIRYSDAVDSAQEALQTLTRLISIAFMRYKKHTMAGLKVYHGKDDKTIEDRVYLCLNLCQMAHHEPSKSPFFEQFHEERDWNVDIATLCQLPEELVELLLEDPFGELYEEIRDSWCQNSAQRLKGYLQDQEILDGWEVSTGELRAGGEWELMLAEALTIASFNAHDGPDALAYSSSSDVSSLPGYEEIVTAQLWRYVLVNAVSHLMPAAALLRFGMEHVGRKPHPFCILENDEDPFDTIPLYFSERLSRQNAVTSSRKKIAYETLSVLSRLCTEGNGSLTLTCHAVSTHLLVDSESFSHLEGLQQIKFAIMGLKHINNLVKGSSQKAEQIKVLPLVVERLISIVETFGKINMKDLPSSKSPEEFQRLLAFFGGLRLCQIDTIVDSPIEALAVLAHGGISEIEEGGATDWSLKALQCDALIYFVAALCKQSFNANEKTRVCLAGLISRIAELDVSTTFSSSRNSTMIIVPAIIRSFNTVHQQKLRELVLHDFCLSPTDKDLSADHLFSLRNDLASIFSFLLLTNPASVVFSKSKVLFDVLIESFDGWTKSKMSDMEPILETFLLYGCKLNVLESIGSTLMPYLAARDENSIGERKTLQLIAKFFGFLQELRDALTKESVTDDAPRTSERPKKAPSTQEILTFPRSCSYIEKSGFHGQHWYNCYTCGLVWDKGCCTLCALVCHKGHDVSYSRYSSFFCDCGAENSSAIEQNRVSCTCLSPISKEHGESLVENERSVTEFELLEEDGQRISFSNLSKHSLFLTPKTSFIAQTSFKASALSSIEEFARNARNAPWFENLFRGLQQELQHWKEENAKRPTIVEVENKPLHMRRISHLSHRRDLRGRRGKPLNLQNLSLQTMVPVRSAKGFKVKISSDSSTNSRLLSKIVRHDLSRSILVSDSRGRMILAETCSLLCYSAIPTVSTRYVNEPIEAPISRQQLCILSSTSIKFNIIGMQLCPENESRLIVWGTSEACVTIFNSDWTKVEEIIDIILDSSQDSGGEYLVTCEWLPGSQTHVALGCNRNVRIYDLTKSDSNKRVLTIMEYSLGFEASLKGLAIVPIEDRFDVKPSTLKVFFLREDGRLNVVDFKDAINDGLDSQGIHRHIEQFESVSLSMTGIRPRSGSSVGVKETSTRTLGEGSCLTYLKQSRVLLYKCASSCVLALMLDKNGDVEGTFEFMPHILTSEAIGEASEGSSISGPYTHWTELGITYNKGSAYFRVVCVGKSSRTGKAKLIYIEFNLSEVRIRGIEWSTSSSLALEVGMVTSFDGLAAFSAPILAGQKAEREVFGERAFFCVVASNGSLLFFGEQCIDTLPSKDGIVEQGGPLDFFDIDDAIDAKPTFPITIFERLKNVTESENLVFGGYGIGSDPEALKSRLLRDTGSSLICPREGCTLTISLRKSSEGLGKFVYDENKLIIAAVRVLVGSTSNCIPSKIYIQGRPIDLVPRVKKWYSLPLTKEEIALAVRNGFMSLAIGPSFDSSNNAVIDSIEVFAMERSHLESSLPKSYYSSKKEIQSELKQRHSRVSIRNGNVFSNGLSLSTNALIYFCDLVKGKTNFTNNGRELLQQLIQETALERDKNISDCAQGLLKRLEPDERSRHSLQDESLLFACSKALTQAKEIVDDSRNSNLEPVAFLLRECLEIASKIARERPMNYLRSMGNIVEANAASNSLASDASDMILDGLNSSAHYEELISGRAGIIELSLIEMAIEHNTVAPQSKQSVNFNIIRNFLESNDANVVKCCCDSIALFCRDHGKNDTNANDASDLFTMLQHARLVAYQCDSCALFPIKEIRYTLLEDEHDIDLCEDCYNLGNNFARNTGFDSKQEVLIKGKTVGAKTKLSCSQMRQLQPVSLEKIDVEQVEVKIASRRETPSNDVSMDEDDLQKAFRLSLANDESGGAQAYEDFVGHLFAHVVELFGTVLKQDQSGPLVSFLVRLLLDLVKFSSDEDSKSNRAKRFAKELSSGISYILNTAAKHQKLPENKVLALIACLRAFPNLLGPSTVPLENQQAEEEDSSNRKKKTNPTFMCDVHKIPAVRRRCAKGTHKDRRFYVCGMERGERCNYFVWADGVETKSKKKIDRSALTSPFGEVVKGYFWNYGGTSGIPLHTRLCNLLEDKIYDLEVDNFDTALSFSSIQSKTKITSAPLKNHYGSKEKEQDFLDGVFCSKEKLKDITSGEAEIGAEMEPSGEFVVPIKLKGDGSLLLLEASLDLLLVVADHKSDGISRWFSLLCEINDSLHKPANIRSLAKKVLKALCGGKQTLYHSVRDHFTFGFQLKRLYRVASPILEAALIVKEKSRVCNTNWGELDVTEWSNVRVGGLIGTQDLISEDILTQRRESLIGKVLEELCTSVGKNRGESWRQFCSLRSLPNSHRDLKLYAKSRNIVAQEAEHYLSAASPIVALLWIASCMTGVNQSKVLKLVDVALVDVALTTSKEQKSSQSKISNSSSEGGELSDDTTPLSQDCPLPPEQILSTGERKVVVDDVVAFAVSFVCGGKTTGLRRSSHNITIKLFHKLSTRDQVFVFQRLFSSAFDGIGKMGKTAVEFLDLLEALGCFLGDTARLTEAASLVMECFEQQMTAMRYDRSNGEWFVLELVSGTSSTKKRFDLSCCQHCHRPPVIKNSTPKQSDRRRSLNSVDQTEQSVGALSTARGTALALPTSQNVKKWHANQVSNFNRGRLEEIKDASASNEFASFYMLKHRVSLSDIYLTVNDPRGRYVKTVTVYFSPRNVTDVGALKSEDYVSKWQRCATLSLARGTSRASASLAHPVVAANLKIEFTEFYERPGGSKASDGSMLVHCPRCTRVVTNAHGVCGNCGEVAFQCRKCRHINYDRLDAFLCVECGYCASGSFSFQLNAGVASNAIAITNDNDYDRGIKMLGAAVSIQNELKHALREKISTIGKKKKSGSKKDDFESVFNSQIQRAFLGLPPIHDTGKERKSNLKRVDEPGSVVKFIAFAENSNSGSRSSSSADRTRSLLRLARQIRSESGGPSSEGRRSSDVLVRQLGRGLSIDDMEDNHDLIDFLESGGGSGSGGTRRHNEDSRRHEASSNTQGNQTDEGAASKQVFEECQKLHLLMREAEREGFELRRRVEAWRHLDSGHLAMTATGSSDSSISNVQFTPSHCSACSSTVGQQLLLLWLRLFSSRPSEIVVDREFLLTLFEDVPGSTNGKSSLSDYKGRVIREIATKSKSGSKLVLTELRKRLLSSHDMTCAEILGKILEAGVDFDLSEEYSKLATDILAR